MNSPHFDYILVGGGLQSGLIVLALRHHQPTARVLLVERDFELAGNHTWSFHPQDVSTTSWTWLHPVVEHRWPSYQVLISGFEKQIELSYASISSSHFAKIIKQTLASFRSGAPESAESAGVLLTATEVTEVHAREIKIASGESFRGRVVIDCRGPNLAREMQFDQCGYQKFWGFELELQADWPFEGPVLMDDRIDQTDGYRFLYSLPFERRRVLVEDTRFSICPLIEREDCLKQVGKYLDSLGVKDWFILRDEHGILPMPISSERLPGDGTNTDEAIAGGYAGGWFHAATGYSFALAMDFAETVASTTPERAYSAVTALAGSHRARSLFSRFLNRMLFCLIKPTKRYQIFRRFYNVLSADSIARFYSHQFTAIDAFRIVVGMPPAGLQPGAFARSYLSRTKRPTSSLASPSKRLESSYEEIGV